MNWELFWLRPAAEPQRLADSCTFSICTNQSKPEAAGLNTHHHVLSHLSRCRGAAGSRLQAGRSSWTALSLAPHQGPGCQWRTQQAKLAQTTWLLGSRGHTNPSTTIRWWFMERRWETIPEGKKQNKNFRQVSSKFTSFCRSSDPMWTDHRTTVVVADIHLPTNHPDLILVITQSVLAGSDYSGTMRQPDWRTVKTSWTAYKQFSPLTSRNLLSLFTATIFSHPCGHKLQFLPAILKISYRSYWHFRVCSRSNLLISISKDVCRLLAMLPLWVLNQHGLKGLYPRKTKGASYKQLNDTTSVRRNRPKFLQMIARSLWKRIQKAWPNQAV